MDIFFPMELYMSSSKQEILDIYKEHKGKNVYFVNEEGKWKLNEKAEIVLIK